MVKTQNYQQRKSHKNKTEKTGDPFKMSKNQRLKKLIRSVIKNDIEKSFQRLKTKKILQNFHNANVRKYIPSLMQPHLKKYGTNFHTSRVIPSPNVNNNLRPIFIDGSNVAFSYTCNKYFGVKGIKMCLDFFLNRGHSVKAFVPRFRQKKKKTNNYKLLNELINMNLIITTPSREVNGKKYSSHDDWYIVQAAAIHDGIIVSCDNYRDIMKKNPEFVPFIENRLLMPTFVNDTVIFPQDPLGRRGPTLNQFLRFY